MRVVFKRLNLRNYKSHRDLVVEFGPVTRISGDNAKGKSSILESISWTLYGTDAFGSKLDPSPIGYDYDEVKAELLLTVDGKDILLGRGLVKGKTAYWINEVPSKATEFSELVESLFDKELFLSLFNPSFFFSLHWEKQRAMLLRYVTAPASKEVLKHLPAPQAEKLGELLKKHSLADIEAIHRDRKNRLERDHLAAQARTRTLQEQLTAVDSAPDVDIETARADIAKIDAAIREAQEALQTANEHNARVMDLERQIQALKDQRDRMKQQWQALKAEEIADTCRVCGQPLQGEALDAARVDKQRRMDEFRREYDDVVAKRKELEAEIAALEPIDVAEKLDEIRRWQEARQAIVDAIREKERRQQLEQQIEDARHAEVETLENLRESTFVIDAVKAFRQKEAELQATKVQELFTTLSIRLFETLKNGEIKPTFEIEYQGRPYSKLSLSEGIRAGLELRDVLSQQSGIVAPCFIDNAESITHFRRPKGQLIISRVVAGQELTIETEGTA